jgi:two-component system cell cycle response regulator
MVQGIENPALCSAEAGIGEQFLTGLPPGTSFANLQHHSPHAAGEAWLARLFPEGPRWRSDLHGSGSNMRILIAEDEVHLCRVLQDLLDPWGYESVVVHDGESALAALRAPDAPRLALLDWLMPGLDGIQVCQKLRAKPDRPFTYLVLMTGQGGRQQLIDGLEAGANDFLVKPVDASELKARLSSGRRIVTLHEQLRELALRDALTGLWNRAAILDLLNRELDRGRREGRPVSVIMADLDHFKRINDTLGHLAGDQVLRQAAGRMRSVLRPYDTVGRYGGEEFLIVLPGCGWGAAASLAERLRQCIATEPMTVEGNSVPVTLSLGIACDGTTASAADLLRAADGALYHAKAAGRNCFMLAPAPSGG